MGIEELVTPDVQDRQIEGLGLQSMWTDSQRCPITMRVWIRHVAR
jgi:hypothetical protein